MSQELDEEGEVLTHIYSKINLVKSRGNDPFIPSLKVKIS